LVLAVSLREWRERAKGTRRAAETPADPKEKSGDYCRLVLRFRRSHHIAARSRANVGIKGALENL